MSLFVAGELEQMTFKGLVQLKWIYECIKVNMGKDGDLLDFPYIEVSLQGSAIRITD